MKLESVTYRGVLASMLGGLLALATALPAVAQETAAEQRRGAGVLLEEIVVTALKREENIQDTPIAMTAYNPAQIDARKIRTVSDLTVGIPNVSLDDVATTKGVANFSIRGLGITASIPSIDPTVGVFVDGVYLGINTGVVFDVFDLESIEVLRGPQGILFGRNVTGGAVLLNTKLPGDEFEAKVRVAVDGGGDGGLQQFAMGSIGGPVSDTLGARLTVHYNNDEGWFTNLYDGSDHGAIEQLMVRPVVVWTPSDVLEMRFRYEYTDISGDGPSSQSHTNGLGIPGTPVNYSRYSHDFNIDEPGSQTNEINAFTWQTDWDVGETGTITNIFGWRDLTSDGLSDIDAQPALLFHGLFGTESEQYSNELRYNGVMADGRVNLTTGLYWFQNDLKYSETRILLGGAQTLSGGGVYTMKNLGAFLSVDYDATDQLTLTAGIRYTKEDKDAQIATLPLNVNAPCDVLRGTCAYDFVSDKSWDNWSPKIGASYFMSDDSMVYASWTRGFRSGGYNLRNSAIDTVNFGPGPFDEETVDNFEIGFKNQFEAGYINGAIFFNKVSDLQADVNLSDPVVGVVQVIRNTADADLSGIELDGVFELTENLVMTASIGALNAQYTKVLFDLNNDGVIDNGDNDLALKRAPKLTWSAGFNYDVDLGSWGYLSSRITYSHRDQSAWNEANTALINAIDYLDIGLDFHTNSESWVFSVYGKNLQNDVLQGGDTQLPSVIGPVPLGGTFSPLLKGRVIGAQLTYTY